jgi:hypothetical protein
MTEHFPAPREIGEAGRAGAHYARDLVERVLATFVVAFGAVAAAAGPADMFSASFWESAAVAGLAAAGSIVKGLVARVVGNRDSASTAPGV